MRLAALIMALAAFAAAAAADTFVVGRRGTDGDYPFRGC
jgi:predicted porin